MRRLAAVFADLCAATLLAAAFWPASEPVPGAGATDRAAVSAVERPSAASPGYEHAAPPVAADLVPPAAADRAALERVTPRAPLGPSRPQATASPPKPSLLHNPVAEAAGRLQAGGHRIELAGLAVTEPDRVCRRQAGGTWPCGKVALTALRNLLRGRAVRCAVPAEPGSDVERTACSLGKVELGEWLVRQGWADASPDGPYAAAAQAARSAERGIWGGGPAD